MREHGTYACYAWGPEPGCLPGRGCRCDQCREAARLQQQKARRRATPAYVAAGPARSHVEWLRSQGVGMKTIAERSGVAHGTLSKLIYGDPATGRGPSKRIKPETRDRLLAVKPLDAADGARVDASRTWEHIETLLARGWTKKAIAREIGQTGPGLQLRRTTVHARHARRIAELLDEPVPPRRSRHGIHPVPQPEPETPREVPDSYNLPTLDLAPVVLRKGACRRPEVPTWLFFPMRGDDEMVRRAKAVCATCSVADACLDFALKNGESGIWGGTTGMERRAMREAAS